jgi:tetratricopeptide (TPR) repeat protein
MNGTWRVAAVPALVSLGLSALTVGSNVYWQDSGFYLTAIDAMSVLYPPGFALYQGLCKAWTCLFFFVDLTLAVHLFSSACAALAAGTLALAARELLRTRSGFFQVVEEDPGPLADWAGAAAGCLAACGYTFWFTGLYAKGYSFYYFILAQLLLRMLRAAGGGSPREDTRVAVLIGLAWAAHPSATLMGPAFLAFVASRARALGWKGVAGRTLLAAAAALGPALVLPFLAARRSLYDMGDPSGPRSLLTHLFGSTYLSVPGVFGWDLSRTASYGRYFWEEFLGIGLTAVAGGIVVLARRHPRPLAALLLWIVPSSLVALWFKMEGQHDCWFLASWLPLFPVAALGLYAAARRAGSRAKPMLAAAALAALAWAVAANTSDLRMRGYDLAERFGRCYLDNLDPDAVVLISGDDPVALCGYLQRVRRARPDVLVVNAERLSSGWYLERLLAAHPFLKAPAPDPGPGASTRGETLTRSVLGFLKSNHRCGRPVFTELRPPESAAAGEFSLVPAGFLWKVTPKGSEAADPRYWNYPVGAGEVRAAFRRARGQRVTYKANEVRVAPEHYESRLLRLLGNSRLTLATTYLSQNRFAEASKLFQDVLDADPDRASDGALLYGFGKARYGLDDGPAARALLEKALELEPEPAMAGGAYFLLGSIHRRNGAVADAKRCWRLGLAQEGIDDRLRQALQRALDAGP